MTHRCLGHRAPLLWLTLPFMAGLAVGKAWAVPPQCCLAAAVCASALAIGAAGRAPRLWAAALAAAMLLAGDASYSLHRKRLPDWTGRRPRAARLSLRVEHVYPQSDGTRKAIGLAAVVGTDRNTGELTGQRIYYSIALRKGQAPPERSAVVSAAGLLTVLRPHPPADGFDGFLDGLGLNFELTRARLIAQERPPTTYHSFCERLARRMNALLTAGLERRPELAGVFRAMMLGRKKDVPAKQVQLFIHSGTLHLFAINGLHIGMVAASLHALLALLRCPRTPAGALVLAALWIDVDTTGASPSAVRAFLMVAALEAGYALRRPNNPLAALTGSALPVLLFDPMDFFSASFRMSYGVVAVILTLGLPLAAWLHERFPAYSDLPEISWSRLQRWRAAAQAHLFQVLGIGIAATLVSAITGIEYFGVFAPGGLAANLALVPLASLVLVAGCASLTAGFTGAMAAGTLFNHAAGVLIRMIEALIAQDIRLPGTWVSAHYRTEWIGPAALAALLAACFVGYACQWRRDRGGWWPPFAVVALTLVFGVKFGG